LSFGQIFRICALARTPNSTVPRADPENLPRNPNGGKLPFLIGRFCSKSSPTFAPTAPPNGTRCGTAVP
jgi:hypothetical protein